MSDIVSGRLSSFEPAFSDWPAGKAIVSTRTDSFDLNHGLFYAPIAYKERDLQYPSADELTDAWVMAALSDFIRDEFSGSNERPFLPGIRDVDGSVDLLDVSLRVRDSLESALIYDANLEDLLAQSGNEPVERVYSLLASTAFGHSLNQRNVSLAEFRAAMVHQRVGCRLVVLGLPFRDQNPARVNNEPSEVTLAESVFLIRLHCTALAIYQVLPTGADIVVLSDGELYAPIFGVDVLGAERYLASVRTLRTKLNLGGTVSIISLKRLIELYDAGSGRFWDTVEQIGAKLEHWLQAPPDQKLERQFSALARGMRWNLNSRTYRATENDLFEWLHSGNGPPGLLPGRDEVELIARRYATINLALRWHKVVAAMLPTTIRATMHPKRGQLALPRLGSCFPWNGVAIMNDTMIPEVHSLAEAARRGMDLIARRSENGSILYYEKDT